MARNWDDIRVSAHHWAKNDFGCSVKIEGPYLNDSCIFVMEDEDGEETARIEVSDAGVIMGRPMMLVKHEYGASDVETLVQAEPDVIVRFLYM